MNIMNPTPDVVELRKFVIGLEPETRYHYNCGDSSLGAMSDEFVFETLSLPGSGKYPPRIAVVGDLGLTMNSTTTIDHLITNDPTIILMVGDLTYANQYLTTGGNGTSCYSCAFPNAPIRETYQPRWDAWGRLSLFLSALPYLETSKLLSFFFNKTSITIELQFTMNGSPST